MSSLTCVSESCREGATSSTYPCKCGAAGTTVCYENEVCDEPSGTCKYRPTDREDAEDFDGLVLGISNGTLLLGALSLVGCGVLGLFCFFVVMPMLGATAAAGATDAGA